MNTVTEQELLEEEILTEQIDIPQRGDFVPCDRCRHRSYYFYLLGDSSLLSYCYHHGNKYGENLLKVATLAADYSDDLKENRLQGAP